MAILLPQTYMNESGNAAGPARGALKVDLDHVVAVHDEIDLPFGEIRTKLGGGLAGHNGLKSLKAGFGSPDFVRVRVGVGGRTRPIPRSSPATCWASGVEPRDEVRPWSIARPTRSRRSSRVARQRSRLIRRTASRSRRRRRYTRDHDELGWLRLQRDREAVSALFTLPFLDPTSVASGVRTSMRTFAGRPVVTVARTWRPRAWAASLTFSGFGSPMTSGAFATSCSSLVSGTWTAASNFALDT